MLGVTKNIWQTVSSYLEDRRQIVKWGNHLSKLQAVLAGVPQGGVLSALLFVLCMNSLMGSLPGQMQAAVDAVTAWGQTYCLSANAGKTKDIVISFREPQNRPISPPIVLNNQAVERVDTFKLLGIQLSSDLKWDAQVQSMLKKAQPRVHYLSVAKRAQLPPDVLAQVYVTFIRPVLEYASPVWASLPKHLIQELESLQRRCCCIIGIPTDSFPTLEARREEATLREFNRLLKDGTSPMIQSLSTNSSHYTLRNGRTLTQPGSHTKRHQMSFLPRAYKLYQK
ncbi:hypothetical protein Bbelb_258190 [Xyrichtys novacula]|uniref:Alkylated DNA repair protein AlkB homologue 8 N-terminal domain-containing protein n=1 Tax=Xyrichtys novacula TaxID=13765 RepID=A0AAV1HMU9_XYRNO|nr:hypothetical protein Bbelb_258190 [Xyrichtys novacula]